MLQSIVFCALTVLSTPAQADFDAARTELEAALLPRLSELAVEANKKRFFATRNRCYRAMLVLDPDDGTARRGLKYKRVEGKWIRAGSARAVKDAKSKKVPEFVQALDDALREHRESVLALVEAHAEELGIDGAKAARERLVQLEPENAELRALTGETRLEGRWVLLETARSVERRKRLRQVARESFESAPIAFPTSPNDFEKELGLPWSTGFQTDRVRVFGTGEPDEVQEAARACHAMGDLFAAAFGRSVKTARDYALYMLANPGEKEQLLRRLPGVRKDRGTNLSQTSGGWLGRSNSFGNWAGDRPRRVDGLARMTASQYLLRTYRVDLRQGWASEGIGVYLVETMVGTRLTWYTKEDRYIAPTGGDGLEQFNLENASLDWLAMGTEMLLDKGAPHLGPLIGRPVGSMTSRDLLHAYVLATYLIEGRPEELPRLLEAIGRGGNPTRAFESVLDETLPRTEARMKRWLTEIEDFADVRSR